MKEKLHVQEANTNDKLLIKPVPGQVIATVDSGSDQRYYAELFAAAPELLAAARAVTWALGSPSIKSDYCPNVAKSYGTLKKVIEEFDRNSLRTFDVRVYWTVEASAQITAASEGEAAAIAQEMEIGDFEDAEYLGRGFEVDFIEEIK